MSEKIMQSVGTVTKKEQLAVVESEVNTKVLLLENQAPYPGYHGSTVPDSLEPDSIFAVTKLMYNDDRVIRCIQAVKKRAKYIDFDAAPGTLSLQNQNVNVIRFKSLPYILVGDTIREFEACGIKFKRAKKVNPYTTLIRIRKFFKIKEMSDGIFQDNGDPCISYIQLPCMLRWATFEKITLSIKYNMDDSNFDAAQTSLYNDNGLVDFVRIYDKDGCSGKLLHIKQSYTEAIEKL